ncbi:hemin receptor [Bacteroidia bacterium]|nr:hemin receptor [Bacteroidia bacterium]
MKRLNLIISALLATTSAVFSQGQLDAYKYGQTDLIGTARYMGMGGAFGALGGDISSMSTNPAGLAVYRSSEVVATLNLNAVNTKTDLAGSIGKADRTRFDFSNIAFEGYFPTSRDAGVIGWNLGFSYNRLKDYHRNYTLRGVGSTASYTDYLGNRATASGYDESQLDYYNDPYRYLNDWQTVLGWNSGFITAYNNDKRAYYSSFGANNAAGDWYPIDITGRELTVQESGAIDQYNMAFGLNISDFILLGADIALTDIDYHYYAFYAEDFVNKDWMTLRNDLGTSGSGYAFNVGAIIWPVNFLRVGVAYNSHTWYNLTDNFSATGESHSTWVEEELNAHAPNTDGLGFADYKYRTPDKWLFSAAAIIGQTALIGVDYELTNYGNMKMYDDRGYGLDVTNNEIKSNFGSVGTLRVGGELKVTPQFAIRAGAAWIGNPVREVLKKGEFEVRTVGTIPHYTIENSITNYSIGLGYRFTPSFYMDLACVLKTQKEDLYAFPNFYEGGKQIVEAPKASLKSNATNVALTFGYKF